MQRGGLRGQCTGMWPGGAGWSRFSVRLPQGLPGPAAPPAGSGGCGGLRARCGQGTEAAVVAPEGARADAAEQGPPLLVLPLAPGWREGADTAGGAMPLGPPCPGRALPSPPHTGWGSGPPLSSLTQWVALGRMRRAPHSCHREGEVAQGPRGGDVPSSATGAGTRKQLPAAPSWVLPSRCCVCHQHHGSARSPGTRGMV